MKVRIYQPAKSAMQSGFAGTRNWRVEYEPEKPKRTDPLMGWTGSSDMRGQIILKFASRDEAVAYAERRGLNYEVSEPKRRRIRPKLYADNFRHGRVRG